MDTPQQGIVIDFVAARLSRLSEVFVADLGIRLKNKTPLEFACVVYHELQGLTPAEYRTYREDFFDGLGDLDDDMIDVIEEHPDLFNLIESVGAA